MPLPLTDMIIVYGTRLVGAMIQGGLGFGFALVAAPVLMLVHPALIPAPLIISGLTLTLLLSFREWSSADAKGVGWLLLGFFPGLAMGSWLLENLPKKEMALFFGFFVLLSVAFSLFRVKFSPPRWMLIPAGILSAIMSITTTMGGPPVALILQNYPGKRFRGTLALFFTLGGISTLVTLGGTGRLEQAQLQDGAWLLPPAVLGFVTSGLVTPWLDRGSVRRAVLILAAGAGITVIAKALLITEPG